MPHLSSCGSSSESESKYPASTESLLMEPEPTGSQRVRFRGAGPHYTWDYALETAHQSVDVALVLPHYRARNQPIDHRLSMYVSSSAAQPVKVKVCRNFLPTCPAKFYLELYSMSTAPVTIWLPSDFKGLIRRSPITPRLTFSAGFTNRILPNVVMPPSRRPSLASLAGDYCLSDVASAGSEKGEDEVVVHARGQVTFRMWDVVRGQPEARCKEVCRRMLGLGCARRAPEVTIDWDFLLED